MRRGARSGPIRLAAVLTHPIQYYAPWFRHMARRAELDLTVVYACEPTPAQQGVGFGRPFLWDVPLREGYRSVVLRPSEPHGGSSNVSSVSSDSFWGVWAPEVADALASIRPDVALVPGWHSATFLHALGACRRAAIPVLYRGDSTLDAAPSGLRGRLRDVRTRALLSLFDAFLAPGKKARDYLARYVPVAHVYDAPHAVDNGFFASAARAYETREARREARAEWGAAPDAFVVLFAGKLQSKKRPLDLVRALAYLPGAFLLVVGSGELEGACRAEAARLSVPSAFLGFLNQSELARAYAAADVLALPSEQETWGLVVNEAMAAGLPCVVTERVGCAPDLVVPGLTGELFPPGDVGAFAAALARVRTARLRGDVAAACQARVERYSFEAATDGVVAASRAVLRRPHVFVTKKTPRVLAACGSMFLVSGLERMTFEVLRTTVERGGAAHAILNGWEWHRLAAFAEDAGVSWTNGRYWHRLSRHARSPITWLRYAIDVLRTSGGLLRDAARFRATHVLVPEFGVALRNAPALLALRALGVPVVLRLGNAPEESAFYRRLFRRAVSPLVDLFVCNSEFTRGALLRAGVPAAKAVVVENAVPSRAGVAPRGVSPAAARDPRRVVYVGQVIPAKGVHLLLDALGLLAARGLEARLDVVGAMDGWEAPEWAGYRDRLRERAGAPDLAGRVRFLGYRDDVAALLAAAAAHAMPSLPETREGFGLAVLEAKGAATPSVVTRSGALPELVRHGRDGWVCEDASAESLADALARVLADPDGARAAGEAARASLGRWSRERFAASWAAVLDAAGGRRRPAGAV